MLVTDGPAEPDTFAVEEPTLWCCKVILQLPHEAMSCIAPSTLTPTNLKYMCTGSLVRYTVTNSGTLPLNAS